MSERHDIYRHIHKGLRLGACGLLTRLGAADWTDLEASRRLLFELREHLALAHKHLDHEDEEINAILREEAMALGRRLDHDHLDHFAAFEALESAIQEVERASGDARAEAGHRLYLRFTRHLGEDLLHMAREEEEAMPVLQARFGDGELEAMHNRIKAQIPLGNLVAYFRLILAGSNPAERIMLMADMRANAPAEVYAAVEAGAARAALSGAEWRALEAGLAQLSEAA
jgi:hypothetical protein